MCVCVCLSYQCADAHGHAPEITSPVPSYASGAMGVGGRVGGRKQGAGGVGWWGST